MNRILTRDEMEARRLAAAADLRLKRGSQAKVATKYEVSRTTASRWDRAIRQGQDLHKRRATGRPCRLTPEQLAQVREMADAGLTGMEIAGAIDRDFGVYYHHDHVYHLLKKLEAN